MSLLCKLTLCYLKHVRPCPWWSLLRAVLTDLDASTINFSAPLIVLASLAGKKEELDENVLELVDNPSFAWIVYLTTALGSTLTLNYLVHCCLGLARKCSADQEEGTCRFILHNFGLTSHIVGTARTKRAATHKLNLMLSNAREMHGFASSTISTTQTGDKQTPSALSSQETSDAVFQNYTLRGERVVSAGSLIWSWYRIYSGDLAEVEGIWLPSRLLIFQVGQVIIGAFTSFVLFQLVGIIADAANEARAEIDRRWNNYPDWVDDLVPTGDEVRWALTPAAWIALTVCTILILNYIPRYVHFLWRTTLLRI